MIGHSVDDLSHNERSGLDCQLEPCCNCPITGPSGGATSRGSKIGWAAGFSFPKSSKVSLSVHSNKNNQGRKRRGGVFISGAGPKMEKKEGLEGQVQVEVGLTEITKSPSSPPRCPLWVVGCGDDERWARLHAGPPLSGLAAGQDGEEVSLTAGPLGQPGLCWVLLIEASQQIKHRNTHPTPPWTPPHTVASPPPPASKMCLY